MNVDAHQHFWRYDPAEYGWIDESMSVLRRDFLPRDLEPLLKATGFDACVAVQARQRIEETRWLLELAIEHPCIAGVVGWVDLQSPDVDRDLETFAGRRKLIGIRHIVQSEPDDFMLRPAFQRGIGALERFNLAYDVLIYPRHLEAAATLVSRFPSQRFVLDHAAKPEIRHGEIDRWRDGLRRLAQFPNVCCKLSGLVTEADWRKWTPQQIRPYIDVAAECFGANRLMIGSDWPVCTLAAPYERVMALVIDAIAPWSVNDRAAVLGGTAARFWNLRPQEIRI
jgi:L-fuconolactonase